MIPTSTRVIGLIAVSALFLAGAWLGWVMLSDSPWDLRPGSSIGQMLGILAALLLLSTLRYVYIRRGDVSRRNKPRSQAFHSVAGILGAALAVMHSQAAMREWSALVLLAALGLLATGIYGRLVSPRRVGREFGRDAIAYFPIAYDASLQSNLASILTEKQTLLDKWDDAAVQERTFVPRVSHWLEHPLDCLRYQRLAALESRLLRRASMEAHPSQHLPERWWRRLHLHLAALFVVGLLAHLITVLFFAAYVADGREIYWWHFTR